MCSNNMRIVYIYISMEKSEKKKTKYSAINKNRETLDYIGRYFSKCSVSNSHYYESYIRKTIAKTEDQMSNIRQKAFKLYWPKFVLFTNFPNKYLCLIK